MLCCPAALLTVLLVPADIPVTGPAAPELKALDALMVEFMEEHKVPGASLAVTKDGRLVYARGFGHADPQHPVQPRSLFRIASVSKPFTAAAILQLVDRGKLRLDEKVVDVLKLQPHLERGQQPDPRWRQITVEHLLRHQGGFDRAQSGDPMFQSVKIAHALGTRPPAHARQIIRYMLGRPLDFDPGTQTKYSNFGYCVLGRVIEAVTGQPYEEYVRSAVLAPLGITDMRIGHTLRAERLPHEVTYHDLLGHQGPALLGPREGQTVPSPYGVWYLEAMDAHGGWVASAVDLVRFASALDGPERFTVFRSERLRHWFARPYAHSGGLAGTSALLVRPKLPGVTWAFLLNASTGFGQGKALGTHLEQKLRPAIRAVEAWPAGDLFAELLK